MREIPMFPLELVAFPTEQLALHIFEERYRELIHDCEKNDITFGIPTYTDEGLKYGTEMRLLRVVKRYPDGACDIICEGIRIFEIQNFENQAPGKLYGQGEVRFLDNEVQGCSKMNVELQQAFKNFYKAMAVDIPTTIDQNFCSYTLVHKAGLILEQEYELLQILTEDERVAYLINYLNVMTTTLTAVDRAKELISLNGHFKYFDPLDFTAFTLKK